MILLFSCYPIDNCLSEVRISRPFHLVDHLQQILTILVLQHRLCHLAELVRRDPSLAEGDALQAGHLQALPFLDHLDEGARLAQRVVRARVQPSKAASQRLHLQLPVLEEALVHRRDLQLTACRRFDGLCHVHHLVRVEVQSHHGIVALGLLRLLLDAQAVAVTVELSHAVAFGIAHPVAEYRGLPVLLGRADGFLQQSGQPAAVEDVVTQYEADRVVTDELLADDERLCQSVGRRLLGVLQPYSEVASVTQQAPERGQVCWGGDDQDVADSRQHQHRDRVIDHRLVKDRYELLADTLGDRIQTCTAATGQYDTFHKL